MSTAGVDQLPASILRRTAANLIAWLALIVRPRKFPAASTLPPTQRLLAGLLLAVLVVGLAMILLDARGLALARTLPVWVVDVTACVAPALCVTTAATPRALVAITPAVARVSICEARVRGSGSYLVMSQCSQAVLKLV